MFVLGNLIWDGPSFVIGTLTPFLLHLLALLPNGIIWD